MATPAPRLTDAAPVLVPAEMFAVQGRDLGMPRSRPRELRRRPIAQITMWTDAIGVLPPHFWHALGRTTPEARFVQGLIHPAAAYVKTREGKPAGVTTHTKRARELLGGIEVAGVGESVVDVIGLDPASASGTVAELQRFRPECWHTSR